MKGLARTGFFLLFTWALTVSVTAADSIRVASLNVCNYLLEDRWIDQVYRRDYPKPEAEKAALRQIIREVEPEILALQEMGPEPFLNELQRDLSIEGVVYPYRAWMQAEDPSRHLAILSKIPFHKVIRHVHLDFPYLGGRTGVKRGLLEAQFRSGKGIWSLFVVHLKSRYTSNEEDPESSVRREKEARAIRNLIRQRKEDGGIYGFLVAGDFNDHPVSAPLRRFLEISGNPFCGMVHAADSRGELWTYFNRKQAYYARIDYFLCSPSLRPHISGDKAIIVDDPLMLEASDHRLLYLDLQVNVTPEPARLPAASP